MKKTIRTIRVVTVVKMEIPEVNMPNPMDMFASLMGGMGPAEGTETSPRVPPQPKLNKLKDAIGNNNTRMKEAIGKMPRLKIVRNN